MTDFSLRPCGHRALGGVAFVAKSFIRTERRSEKDSRKASLMRVV